MWSKSISMSYELCSPKLNGFILLLESRYFGFFKFYYTLLARSRLYNLGILGMLKPSNTRLSLMFLCTFLATDTCGNDSFSGSPSFSSSLIYPNSYYPLCALLFDDPDFDLSLTDLDSEMFTLLLLVGSNWAELPPSSLFLNPLRLPSSCTSDK